MSSARFYPSAVTFHLFRRLIVQLQYYTLHGFQNVISGLCPWFYQMALPSSPTNFPQVICGTRQMFTSVNNAGSVATLASPTASEQLASCHLTSTSARTTGHRVVTCTHLDNARLASTKKIPKLVAWTEVRSNATTAMYSNTPETLGAHSECYYHWHYRFTCHDPQLRSNIRTV